MGVYSEWNVAERRLREFDEAHPLLQYCGYVKGGCPSEAHAQRYQLVRDLQLAQYDAAAEANLDAAADADIEGSDL